MQAQLSPLSLASAQALSSDAFMRTGYNLWLVLASILIASLTAFVALDLARRVRNKQDRANASLWLSAALVLGSGAWSMHFIGLQALELPITLGYSIKLSLLAWLVATLSAGAALSLASHSQYRHSHLFTGSLVLGGGMSAMHYLGLAAMDMSIAIVWDWALVAASLALATSTSAIALLAFQISRRVKPEKRLLAQITAACIMGAAVYAMHYTSMAGAHFPYNSICLSTELDNTSISAIMLVVGLTLLPSSLLITVLDSRLGKAAHELSRSLKESDVKLQKATSQLQQRAYTDALTGLPNRLDFELRLNHALIRMERNGHQGRIALLFINLDGFKAINDSFGHAVGDAVLVDSAKRLRSQLNAHDTIARVGGDEFLLLLEQLGGLSDATSMARHLLHIMTAPFVVEDKTLELSCSIGIVVHPDHGESDKLIAHADAAMHVAKHTGGNNYVVFEPHMGKNASEEFELQTDLRHALELNQLALYYQPKIDSSRNCISGVEALLRWKHPVRGMISPAVFIPLAERFGLINRLGNWVIEEACRQIAAWREAGMLMRVAINLSVHQLSDPKLTEHIAHCIARYAVNPEQLLCEITESVAMEDIKATQATFDALRGMGIYLSIDDFGTGYSSLSYLRQLPAQQLKIDRSFICDIEHKKDARAVVDAVIRLAHALDLHVVAEGVETPGQHNILVTMGCDQLQGFFYSRPLPADELLAWAQGQVPSNTPLESFAPSIVAPL